MRGGKVKLDSRLMKRAASRLADLSMRTKLLVLFLAFSVILVVSVGLLAYRSSSAIIDRQGDVYSDSILQQITERIDELRDEVLKVSIPIVTNPSIQDNDLESVDMVDFMDRQYDINTKITLTMFMKKMIGSIYICSERGVVISSERISDRDRAGCSRSAPYRAAFERGTEPLWIGVRDNEFSLDRNRSIFSFARTLYSKETFKPFGVLIINLPAAVLDEICGQGRSGILIVDKEGRTLYRKAGAEGQEVRDSSYISAIAAGSAPSGTFRYKDAGGNFSIHYIASKNGDWTYVSEMPVNYLTENSARLKQSMTIILAAAILMSVASAYLLSAYFTNPIRSMIRTMRKVQRGDFEIALDIENRSEIGQLASSYRIMLGELKRRMEEIGSESRKKREAELNALQAQITPHFLYNTLNSIRIMARMQKAGGIEELTAALIDLLRLSISKKSALIPIREELEIVRKYILLQNYRSGNGCTLVCEVGDEELLRCMMPKLSLQPIVENCILHGFGLSGGRGRIDIAIRREGTTIRFDVTDDGAGMNEEQIDAVWNGNSSGGRRFSGIGIRNIHERIVMLFGSGYGVSLESRVGEYTKVRIALPAIRVEEETA